LIQTPRLSHRRSSTHGSHEHVSPPVSGRPGQSAGSHGSQSLTPLPPRTDVRSRPNNVRTTSFLTQSFRLALCDLPISLSWQLLKIRPRGNRRSRRTSMFLRPSSFRGHTRDSNYPHCMDPHPERPQPVGPANSEPFPFVCSIRPSAFVPLPCASLMGFGARCLIQTPRLSQNEPSQRNW
jgi:hypothetical protein